MNINSVIAFRAPATTHVFSEEELLNREIQGVCEANTLPNIDLLHHAKLFFNLLGDDHQSSFKPSLEVKRQLYYAAHTHCYPGGAVILNPNFNYATLNSVDLGHFIQIIVSYQRYGYGPAAPLFSPVVEGVKLYIRALSLDPQYFSDPIVKEFINLANYESLKQEMVTNARPEQKKLLAYVANEELKEIHSYYNHERQKELVDLIKSGTLKGWRDLIDIYKKDKTFPIHSILTAAYCQRCLNIDDLATAFIFLSPAVSGHSYTIHSFDEFKDNPDVQEKWRDLNAIPPNQRFFVSITKEELSQQGQFLLTSLFDNVNRNNDVAGGIRIQVDQKKQFAMGSAGLMRADAMAAGHPPVFVLGLTPNRSSMYDNLLNRLSDVALLSPKDMKNNLIHSAEAKSILAYVHDGFHTVTRARSGLLERPDILMLGKRLEVLLGKIPDYSNPTVVVRDKEFYPYLEKSPCINDIIRYILDEASGQIIDGEALGDYKESPAIDIVVAAIRSKWSKSVKVYGDERLRVLICLNNYVKELNVNFFMTCECLDFSCFGQALSRN